MDNKKKEELQSRRDFFKKAAKGVLPVLGAVVLAGVPNIMKAVETPMGCQYGCSTGCYSGCKYTCQTTCRGDCQGSCRNTCLYTCHGTCKNSCRATCEYSNK